jgi:hypothetical protein
MSGSMLFSMLYAELSLLGMLGAGLRSSRLTKDLVVCMPIVVNRKS